METIPRADWAAVTESFLAFFAGLGTVDADPQTLSFTVPGEGTGLSLDRAGTSTSFMPLHDLNARWDSVTFDHQRRAVVIAGPGFSYTYRVPRGLVRS